MEKTVLGQIETTARNIFQKNALDHFNGNAIRTTRSTACYLSNRKLFHCWAILCHAMPFQSIARSLTLLKCVCVCVFVLPTCRVNHTQGGIDIFVLAIDHGFNSVKVKNNIYVRSSIDTCKSDRIHICRTKWWVIEIFQPQTFTLKSKLFSRSHCRSLLMSTPNCYVILSTDSRIADPR